MLIIALFNRSWRIVAALASTSFLLLLVLAPMVQGLPVEPMTGGLQWLHVKGSSIVREDGAAMILRGANLPDLDPSDANPEKYEPYLSAAKSMGFNIVRLPILWAGLEPSPGRFSSRYLNSILRIVTLAEKREMYVVVDMHQFKTSGFPSWTGFRTEDQAALSFWGNPALQAELTQAWKMLASLLDDEKAVAGYDLLNEPYAGPISWQKFASILNDFYSKLIAEIRSIDSKHLIFFEPVDGTCVLGEHVALRPEGANLVFSPHFYVRGPSDYLENTILRLYDLAVNSWNIPMWIGEFGGTNVQIDDQDSLRTLATILDLFDRYKLGWAYWTMGEKNRNPNLVDRDGQTSPMLTSIIVRIFPSTYNLKDLTFSYNSTPRFQLAAFSVSGGIIQVSAARTLHSMVARCVDCNLASDDGKLTFTIQVAPATMAYFYLDIPESLARVKALAESGYDRALQLMDSLGRVEIHSPLGREFAGEARGLVVSMLTDLTVQNYELAISKLSNVTDLWTRVGQEEDNYRRTTRFIDSVKQEILSSQGHLSSLHVSLLSQAHQNLDQGDYSLAIEWAKKARDLPPELPRNEENAAQSPDPHREQSGLDLHAVLWQASLILLASVISLTILGSFRSRFASHSPSRSDASINETWTSGHVPSPH